MTVWRVIVDYWLGEWTYGVYPTEAAAIQAASECSPTQGTVIIRRAT